MLNFINYKEYSARIDLDLEADIVFGRVLDIKTVITFQSETVAGIRKEFAASVDDYLAFCAERGEAPERPYAGRGRDGAARADPRTCPALADDPTPLVELFLPECGESGPARALVALVRGGLATIGAVASRSEADLLAVRNFGPVSYAGLRARLEAYAARRQGGGESK